MSILFALSKFSTFVSYINVKYAFYGHVKNFQVKLEPQYVLNFRQ